MPTKRAFPSIKRVEGSLVSLFALGCALREARLSENALFQITLNRSGGLVIQSVEDNKTEMF